MKKLFVAAALMLPPAAAMASITTISGNYSVSNWFSDSKGAPSAGPEFDPLLLNFSVTFDNSGNIDGATTGLTIFSTNFTSPLNYAYNVSNNYLVIGTNASSQGAIVGPGFLQLKFVGQSGLGDIASQVNSFDDVFGSVSFTSLGPAGPVNSAVPEPASWAMLIAGFGLICAALRRRRALPA